MANPFNVAAVLALNFEANAPTRVNQFAAAFGEIISQHVPDEHRNDYYSRLYDFIVVKAKVEKPRAAAVFDAEGNYESGGIPFLSDGDNAVEMFRVVSGNNSRSNLDRMILTWPMAQALISIAISARQIHAGKTPAPLCAKVRCTNPDFVRNNWGIHGHSGLNFVANYSVYVRNENTEQAREMANRIPPVSLLYGLAMGIAATNTGAANAAEASSLRSFFVAIGNTPAPQINRLEWGTVVTGSAAANRARAAYQEAQAIFAGLAAHAAPAAGGGLVF